MTNHNKFIDLLALVYQRSRNFADLLEFLTLVEANGSFGFLATDLIETGQARSAGGKRRVAS